MEHSDLQSLEEARQSKLQKYDPPKEEYETSIHLDNSSVRFSDPSSPAQGPPNRILSDAYLDDLGEDYLLLGVFERGSFHCKHESGCQASFDSVTSLETHFKYEHLSFTRIVAGLHYTCGHAGSPFDSCQRCLAAGPMLLYVYGIYHRTTETSIHNSHQIASARKSSTWDQSRQVETNNANVTAPATDSGYHSLDLAQAMKSTRNMVSAYTSSINSDNRDLQLPQEAKYKLAAAFSREICQTLEPVLHQYEVARLPKDMVENY